MKGPLAFLILLISSGAWAQSLNVTRSIQDGGQLKKLLKVVTESPKPAASAPVAQPASHAGRVFAPNQPPTFVQPVGQPGMGMGAGMGMGQNGMMGNPNGQMGLGQNAMMGRGAARGRGNRIVTTVFYPRVVGLQTSSTPGPNGTWECFLEGDRKPTGSQNYRYLTQAQQRQIELFEDEGGWDPLISKKVRPGERFASVGMQKKYGNEAGMAQISQTECYRMLGYTVPKSPTK
ncbi:MAG: hypothetical protein JNL01_07155 [Bdellovibrionales bacterium]|nr:hypothetical protein [Bdellovibrionales bacterium]